MYVLPSAEEGLPGWGGRHCGPVCDWCLPGKRQEDGHLWGLPAGLLRRRERGVPVRLQGVCLFRANIQHMAQSSGFVSLTFLSNLEGKQTMTEEMSLFIPFRSIKAPFYGFSNNFLVFRVV